MTRVLLDSTYLLPSFGIEVEGLTERHIAQLREAVLSRKVKLYCLLVAWVEVIGKVCREAKRAGIIVDEVVEAALKSLFESKFYTWISPNLEAIRLAFKLRMLGHRDNVDNLLYATSVVHDMILLTMDQELKIFLANHGYSLSNVMDHVQLIEKIHNI
ncbi:MAG: hypothetical protein DRJ41_01775 [Thermoprotei archaeon]|nr:MAG: hypothetical protein DRJ41_01775 [Thermoprotei archaeon]